MNRTLKTILIVLISMFVIYIMKVAFTSLLIGGGFMLPINYEKAEKKYDSRKEDIHIVSEYLSGLEYENIYIPRAMKKGIMSVGGEHVNIENDEVIQALDKLNCDVIGKMNNTIYFQMWSSLDEGRGIAYSMDDSEPKLQFLTSIEKLKVENWYYYEEDYSEWRLKNEP